MNSSSEHRTNGIAFLLFFLFFSSSLFAGLHKYVESDNLEAIRRTLELSSNLKLLLNEKDADDQTPLELANKLGNQEIIAELTNAEAKIATAATATTAAAATAAAPHWHGYDQVVYDEDDVPFTCAPKKPPMPPAPRPAPRARLASITEAEEAAEEEEEEESIGCFSPRKDASH